MRHSPLRPCHSPHVLRLYAPHFALSGTCPPFHCGMDRKRRKRSAGRKLRTRCDARRSVRPGDARHMRSTACAVCFSRSLTYFGHTRRCRYRRMQCRVFIIIRSQIAPAHLSESRPSELMLSHSPCCSARALRCCGRCVCMLCRRRVYLCVPVLVRGAYKRSGMSMSSRAHI